MTSIRRPRVITVDKATFGIDQHADCIDDDLFEFTDQTRTSLGCMYQWCRVLRVQRPQVVYEWSFCLNLQHTKRVDDPLEWFAALFEHDKKQHFIDSIDLDPGNPKVRAAFPWLNRFWKLLSIENNYHTDESERKRSFHVSFFDGWKAVTVPDDPASIAELLRVFKVQNVVRQQLEVESSSVDIACVTNVHVEASRLRIPLVVRVPPHRLILETSPAHIVALQSIVASQRLLTNARVTVHPPQYSLNPVKTGTTSRLALELTPNAHSQWFGYHRTILNVSVAFDLRLPPYVLLEVFDWLPYFDYWPRLRKVELIESVMRSIRRLPRRLNSGS